MQPRKPQHSAPSRRKEKPHVREDEICGWESTPNTKNVEAPAADTTPTGTSSPQQRAPYAESAKKSVLKSSNSAPHKAVPNVKSAGKLKSTGSSPPRKSSAKNQNRSKSANATNSEKDSSQDPEIESKPQEEHRTGTDRDTENRKTEKGQDQINRDEGQSEEAAVYSMKRTEKKMLPAVKDASEPVERKRPSTTATPGSRKTEDKRQRVGSASYLHPVFHPPSNVFKFDKTKKAVKQRGGALLPKPPVHPSTIHLEATCRTLRTMLDEREKLGISSSPTKEVDGESATDGESKPQPNLKILTKIIPKEYVEPRVAPEKPLRHKTDPVSHKPRVRRYDIGVGTRRIQLTDLQQHGESSSNHKAKMETSCVSTKEHTSVAEDESTLSDVLDLAPFMSDPFSSATVDQFIEAHPQLRVVLLGDLTHVSKEAVRNVYYALSRNVNIQKVIGTFPPDVQKAIDATLEANDSIRKSQKGKRERAEREALISEMEDRIRHEAQERKAMLYETWRQRIAITDDQKAQHTALRKEEDDTFKDLMLAATKDYHSSNQRKLAREEWWHESVANLENRMNQCRDEDSDNECKTRAKMEYMEKTQRMELLRLLRTIRKKCEVQHDDLFQRQYNTRKDLFKEERSERRQLESVLGVQIRKILTELREKQDARRQAERQKYEEERVRNEELRIEAIQKKQLGETEFEQRRVIEAELSKEFDSLKRRKFEAAMSAKHQQKTRENAEKMKVELSLADSQIPRMYFKAVSSGLEDTLEYIMNPVGHFVLLNPDTVLNMRLENAAILDDAQKCEKLKIRGGVLSIKLTSPQNYRTLCSDSLGREGVVLYIESATPTDPHVSVLRKKPHVPGTRLVLPKAMGASRSPGASPRASGASRRKSTRQSKLYSKEMIDLLSEGRTFGTLSLGYPDSDGEAGKNTDSASSDSGEELRGGGCGTKVLFNGQHVATLEKGYAGGPCDRSISADHYDSEQQRPRMSSIAVGKRRMSEVAPTPSHPLRRSNTLSTSTSVEVLRLRILEGCTRDALSEILGNLAYFNSEIVGYDQDKDKEYALSLSVSLQLIFAASAFPPVEGEQEIPMATTPRKAAFAKEGSETSSTSPSVSPTSTALVLSPTLLEESSIPLVASTKTSQCFIKVLYPHFAVPSCAEELFLEDSPPLTVFPQFCMNFPRNTLFGNAASATQTSGIGGEYLHWKQFSEDVTTDLSVKFGISIQGYTLALSILHHDFGDVFLLGEDSPISMGGTREVIVPSTELDDKVKKDEDLLENAVDFFESSFKEDFTAFQPVPSSGDTPFSSEPHPVDDGVEDGGGIFSTQPPAVPLPEKGVRRTVREILFRGRVVAFCDGPLLTHAEFLECLEDTKKEVLEPDGTPAKETDRYSPVVIRILHDTASSLYMFQALIRSINYCSLTKDPHANQRHVDLLLKEPNSSFASVHRRTLKVVPVDDATVFHMNEPEVGCIPYRVLPEIRNDLQQYLPKEKAFCIAPYATAWDPDSIDFEGGYLEVEIMEGAQDGDCLYIAEDVTQNIHIDNPSEWDPLQTKKDTNSSARVENSELEKEPSSPSKVTFAREPSVVTPSGMESTCPRITIISRKAPEAHTHHHRRTGNPVQDSEMYVTEGLALPKCPGVITRRNLSRARRGLASIGSHSEQAATDAAGVGTRRSSLHRRGSVAKDISVDSPTVDEDDEQRHKSIGDDQEDGGKVPAGETVYTFKKIRISFRKCTIASLEELLRRIAFKPCGTHASSARKMFGRRRIELRAIVGDPTIPKYRKFDPFVPIVSSVTVLVCEPLIQSSMQTATYKEGMGAMPISMINLADEMAIGNRPFNQGYLHATLIDGANSDDRLYIRSLDPQTNDNGLGMVEIDPSILRTHIGGRRKQSRRGFFEPRIARGDPAIEMMKRKPSVVRPTSSRPEGDVLEGPDARCPPPPIMLLDAVERAIFQKTKHSSSYRCNELYNSNRALVGINTSGMSELFVGFRLLDKVRNTGKVTKGKKEEEPRVGKRQPAYFSKQHAPLDVKLPLGATPLSRRNIFNLLRLVTYECRSSNPTQLRKVALISLCDGLTTSVTHVPIEIMIQPVDDVTEIHRHQSGPMVYRHGSSCSYLAIFDKCTLYDPDTEFFNSGHFSCIMASGEQEGDRLKFMTLEEQRIHKQKVQNDPFAKFRLGKPPKATTASKSPAAKFMPAKKQDSKLESVSSDDSSDGDGDGALDVEKKEYDREYEFVVLDAPFSVSHGSTSISRAASPCESEGKSAGDTKEMSGRSTPNESEPTHSLLPRSMLFGGPQQYKHPERKYVYLLNPGICGDENFYLQHPEHGMIQHVGWYTLNVPKGKDREPSHNLTIHIAADIDEDHIDLEEDKHVEKPVANNIKMLQALMRCIVYTTSVVPQKVRTMTRSIVAKVTPGGGAEEGKARIPINVLPCLINVGDGEKDRNMIYRRKMGQISPFTRFMVLADTLLKNGYVCVEIVEGASVDDVVQLQEIGMGKMFILRNNGKTLHNNKDLYCGSFHTLEGEKGNIRGFVLAFDTASRMTGSLVQLLVRSFSYKNVTDTPYDAERVLRVTLCEGGMNETSMFEINLKVEIDPEAIEVSFGSAGCNPVYILNKPHVPILPTLDVINAGDEALRKRLTTGDILQIEGITGDHLFLKSSDLDIRANGEIVQGGHVLCCQDPQDHESHVLTLKFLDCRWIDVVPILRAICYRKNVGDDNGAVLHGSRSTVKLVVKTGGELCLLRINCLVDLSDPFFTIDENQYLSPTSDLFPSCEVVFVPKVVSVTWKPVLPEDNTLSEKEYAARTSHVLRLTVGSRGGITKKNDELFLGKEKIGTITKEDFHAHSGNESVPSELTIELTRKATLENTQKMVRNICLQPQVLFPCPFLCTLRLSSNAFAETIETVKVMKKSKR